LYRGADPEWSLLQQQQLWFQPQDPPPDLLIQETHGTDRAALEYFECLERQLLLLPRTTTTSRRNNNNNPKPRLVARPSNGHIATSNPIEAGKWGPIVSIWPLGSQWSYVWPRDRPLFYDYYGKNTPGAGAGQERPPSVSRTALYPSSAISSCRNNKNDVLIVNTGLSHALRQSHEVLFATPGGGSWTNSGDRSGAGGSRRSTSTCSTRPSAFLAIPIDQDEQLRNALEDLQYGLLSADGQTTFVS
jgi:hypothetical protein